MKVSTKSEFKNAVNKKESVIEAFGSLASDINRSYKIAMYSKKTLIVLTALIGLTPFTGGISMFAAAPIAALTGIEISAIILISSIGISLIMAVSNGYDVEYTERTGHLRLTKK